MAQLKNTTISDTGFLQLPVGTTAQRPTPAAGQMRFNTNAGKAEFYNSAEAAWVPTLNRGVIATGGTVYDTDVEGTTYRVHVFTSTGNSTFAVTRGGPVEYLVVAGGGPGGNTAGTQSGQGGGGGAGGLATGITTVTTQSYNIAVGAGGVGVPNSSNKGSNGQNTTALGLTTLGGGAGGGGGNTNGNDGGSGGGGGTSGGAGATAGNALQPGSASGGFGNAGGPALNFGGSGGGGGGGGAGGAGATGDGNASSANGGIGLSSNITGIFNFYAGGGASGAYNGPQRFGGLGGGGNGEFTQQAQLGTPNTGGGGGGGASSLGPAGPLDSGSGASGIVIIRYPLRQENPVTAAGKVVGDALVLDLDFAKPTVYAGAGTTVSDSRLNGITGTLVNSPVFADPRTHKSSFTFNGVDTNINCGNDPSINFGTGSFTVTVWFRRFNSATTNLRLLSKAAGGDTANAASAGFCFFGGNSNIVFAVNPTGPRSFVTAGTFALNEWVYSVGVVERGVSMRGYKNGVLLETITAPTGSVSGTTSLFLGDNVGSNLRWFGEIAAFSLYNRALTTTEVAQQYNATRWRFGV